MAVREEDLRRDTGTIELDAEHVRRLHALTFGVSNDPSRAVLRGVHFTQGRAEVTDSYLLVELPLDYSGPSTIIDGKTLRDALGQAKKAKVGATITVTGDGARLESAGMTVILPITDGEFVNTATLWPANPSPSLDGAIGMNAKRLAKVSKALDCTGPMRFTFQDALKPFVIEPIGSDSRALVMPVRLS